MNTIQEFHTEHNHPTLGELGITFTIAASGELRLRELRYVHKTVVDGFIERKIYALHFDCKDNTRWQTTWYEWRPGNGMRGGFSAVRNEPFLDEVNAFANSATLRRIMHRKLDAALRSLQIARRELSARTKQEA